MKKTSISLKGICIAICLFSTINLYASPPKWSSGYPKVVNGASSMDLTFNTDQGGKVYYAIYNVSPLNLTAALVKSNAIAGVTGSIVKAGTLAISAATDVKSLLTGLKDNQTYYVCAIAENAAGELQSNSDIKNFSVSLPKRQSERSYTTKLVSNGMIGYLAYFPEEYYKNPNANYPVLIFLHGMGEKTWMTDNISQLFKVKANGPPMLIDKGQEFPFIVISPQCPFADWDSPNNVSQPGVFVDEIVEMVKSTYRIDLNRIYMSGLSMGGGGTFSYIQKHASKLAAAIPIAGWGDPAAARNVTLPLWVFQGQNDNSATMTSLVNTINVYRASGVEKAKITVYAGVGHDAWTETYNNTGPGIAPDNIYDWLMRHSKSGAAVTVNQKPSAAAGADVTLTLPSNAASLSGSGKDTDGTIASYTWTQQSGPAISLAKTNTAGLSLTGLTAGTYVFRLSVTDNAGDTAFDDVTVIVNPAPSNSTVVTQLGISGLVLADADKDVEIAALVNGYNVNLGSTVKNFTIIAKNSTSDIGSIVFNLDGQNFRIENSAPYSLTGICNPGYPCYNSWWKPSAGTHTVTATAYSGVNGTGTKGASFTVSFSASNAAAREGDNEDVTLNAGAVNASPNPFSDQVTLSFNAPLNGNLKISISNLTGSTVYAKETSVQNQSMLVLNLPNQEIEAGIYTLQVENETFGKKIIRLIK